MSSDSSLYSEGCVNNYKSVIMGILSTVNHCYEKTLMQVDEVMVYSLWLNSIPRSVK